MQVNLLDETQYLNEALQTLIINVLNKASTYFEYDKAIELDISFVSSDEIQKINKMYRKIDRPTDVLSFPLEQEHWGIEALDQTEHLGDIIIAYPIAVAQADEYEHSIERELAFLAVHGFLHLNGYDHQTEAEEKEMFALQERILSDYGLYR